MMSDVEHFFKSIRILKHHNEFPFSLPVVHEIHRGDKLGEKAEHVKESFEKIST